MSYVSSIRTPKTGQARIATADDFPQQIEFDEIVYDPFSLSYKTLSQQKEIDELKNELNNKKIQKEKDLKNIISYFYRR